MFICDKFVQWKLSMFFHSWNKQSSSPLLFSLPRATKWPLSRASHQSPTHIRFIIVVVVLVRLCRMAISIFSLYMTTSHSIWTSLFLYIYIIIIPHETSCAKVASHFIWNISTSWFENTVYNIWRTIQREKPSTKAVHN